MVKLKMTGGLRRPGNSEEQKTEVCKYLSYFDFEKIPSGFDLKITSYASEFASSLLKTIIPGFAI